MSSVPSPGAAIVKDARRASNAASTIDNPAYMGGDYETDGPRLNRLEGQSGGFFCSPKRAAVSLGILQIIVELMAMWLTYDFFIGANVVVENLNDLYKIDTEKTSRYPCEKKIPGNVSLALFEDCKVGGPCIIGFSRAIEESANSSSTRNRRQGGSGSGISSGSNNQGSGSNDPGSGSNDPGSGSNNQGSGSNDPGSGSNDPGSGSSVGSSGSGSSVGSSGSGGSFGSSGGGFGGSGESGSGSGNSFDWWTDDDDWWQSLDPEAEVGVVQGEAAVALQQSSHFYVATNDNCEEMSPTGRGASGILRNPTTGSKTYVSYTCVANDNFTFSSDDIAVKPEEEGKGRRHRRELQYKQGMIRLLAEGRTHAQARVLLRVEDMLTELKADGIIKTADQEEAMKEALLTKFENITEEVKYRRLRSDPSATTVSCAEDGVPVNVATYVTPLSPSGSWVLTPDSTGLVSITTCGTTIEENRPGDTILTVDGTPYDDEGSCPGFPYTETLNIDSATAGTPIYFQAQYYNSDTAGIINVTVTCGGTTPPPPPPPAALTATCGFDLEINMPAFSSGETVTFTPLISGIVEFSTCNTTGDTLMTPPGDESRDDVGPRRSGCTGSTLTETESVDVTAGVAVSLSVRFHPSSELYLTGGLLVLSTTCSEQGFAPTQAPTFYVFDFDDDAAEEDASFQQFASALQDPTLLEENRTYSYTIEGRRRNKTIRRSSSYVRLDFFADSACKERILASNDTHPEINYTESFTYDNSPINLPDKSIGPPYGVFCTGYAPVGQFKKVSCTIEDVLAKRNGCIQLVNPISGKYWYDTAYSSCRDPKLCDGRKNDIVGQANEVKAIVQKGSDWLLIATVTQASAIGLAVLLHFFYETILSGSVFKYKSTIAVFIIKNILVMISAAANIYIGITFSIDTISNGQTALDWLDQFIDNECFDSEGTVALVETRAFIAGSTLNIILIGCIILVDSFIEDNISIVVEGTREEEEESKPKKRVSTISSSSKTLPGSSDTTDMYNAAQLMAKWRRESTTSGAVSSA